MNSRTAPLVRVAAGISLALLCVHLGLQRHSGEWDESPPPTPEEASVVPDEAPSTAARPASPPAPALSEPPAVDSALASCGPSCGGGAAPVELSWGAGQVAAARVSAAPVEDTPPARGADVAVAFAQMAAQSAMPATTPGERGWPSQPAVTSPPGSTGWLEPATAPAERWSPSQPAVTTPTGSSSWLEPVVSALFEPDTTPPTSTGTDATLPAPPQGEATTPMAEPQDAHPISEGSDPSSPTTTPIVPAGAPFKRDGQPGDKASGRAPAPLAGAPGSHPCLPARSQGQGQGQGGQGGQGSQGGPGGQCNQGDQGDQGDLGDQGDGAAPNPSGLPFTDTPPSDAPLADSPGRAPTDLPLNVPAWVPPVFGPGQAPVFGHTPQPGSPAPWVPLLADQPLVDRVATGPQARAEDLLTPGLEPAAAPLEAVVAAVVTEPGSLTLLAIAALGLAGLQRQPARVAGARTRAPGT